jgi:electron transfer flavoprotein alpha subunit
MTLRRDPRAELERRRKRETPTPPGSSPEQPRLRRDPRAERSQRRVGTAPPQPAPTAPGATGRSLSPEAAVRIVESPACLILAIPDLEDGRLTAHDRDLLGAARQLADALGGAVVAFACLAPAAPTEDFGAAGVDRLLRADDAAFVGYAPEAKAAATVAAIERLQPRRLAPGFADRRRRLGAPTRGPPGCAPGRQRPAPGRRRDRLPRRGRAQRHPA